MKDGKPNGARYFRAGTCSEEKWRGWREGLSGAEDDHNGKRSNNGSEYVNTALEQLATQTVLTNFQYIHSNESVDNTIHQQEPA